VGLLRFVTWGRGVRKSLPLLRNEIKNVNVCDGPELVYLYIEFDNDRILVRG